ncbi:MAG TPA: tetratricopeptide repeat protein [Longimicrobiales bacterium]|nr:tetratricopeptide repeat protein [Longimicrobiales bacterium]
MKRSCLAASVPVPSFLVFLVSLSSVAVTPRGAGAQVDPARVDTLRTAVERSRAQNDSAALAEALNAYGLYLWNQADYDSAAVNLQAARSVWTALDDSVGLGRVFNNLGVTHFHWGNLEEALDSYLRSLSVRRALGDRRGVARVLTNMGLVYSAWGQRALARRTMEEAVAEADASGDAFVRGYARSNLGVALLADGDAAEARRAFEESLRLFTAEDSGLAPAQVVTGRGLNMHGLGRVQLMEGDARGAVATLEEILGGSAEGARTGRQADVLLDLGRAYQAAGASDRAVRTLERVVELSRDADQWETAAEALGALSEVFEARGEPMTALRHLRSQVALQDSVVAEGGARRIASVTMRLESERHALENRALREEQRAQEAVIARQRLGFLLGGALLAMTLALAVALVNLNRQGRARRREMATANRRLEAANQGLRDALAQVRTLEGLIPICSRCKKVRDDEGFWESVESYVSSRSDVHFSHGICSECGPELYGEFWDPGLTVSQVPPADPPAPPAAESGAGDEADPARRGRP